jgi:phospholipid N-methyltransferase
MAVVKPIVINGGQLERLQNGDTILNVISGTAILNFSIEQDVSINTISSALITNSNIVNIVFIPQETTETSLDDFKLNGVSFNIENIVDATSFDIRGNASNNASGNYTIKYIINYI